MTTEPAQTPPPAETDDLEWPVRIRLRDIRLARQMSFARAAQLAELHRSHVLKIETGTARHLNLDEVYRLARAYAVSPKDILDGWAGSKIPYSAHPVVSWSEMDRLVRARMRRSRGTRGTPTVARAIGIAHSTLVRMESGERENLKVAIVRRLAQELGADLGSWLEQPTHPGSTPR